MDNSEIFQLEWLKRHPVDIRYKFDGAEEDRPVVSNTRKKKRKVPKIAPGKKIIEIQADEEIDLHGLTIEQGIFELELFLEMAREFNLACVRVVHGIGPEKGPSLRKEVRKFLKTRGKSKISRFIIEPHNDGAVVIFP